ncbi:hypothetical protein KFL_004340090 [Klebsormidium nitens]|uniref:EF-hand domain-containing protein n=1 Tax=Klebsormidium nitens TaxID=105231 RepID=A0A1Y1IET0_KLENI|nr:hypothetical protein KFL_004340090 [Klebsormidium nitens]|eukprot:GAQ88502.1 hypothetical protein KFL_004340090 [Klebsormidium nitens]
MIFGLFDKNVNVMLELKVDGLVRSPMSRPGSLGPGQTADNLQATAETYLTEYRVNDLLTWLLRELLVHQPAEPIQFMVDLMTFPGDPSRATQDGRGLSEYRKSKLLALFHQMDKDDSGSVEFKEIYAHSSKYGGMALTPEELKAVFQDFDTSGDSKVTVDEFLTFFSRTLVQCSNEEFDEMMKEMLD